MTPTFLLLLALAAAAPPATAPETRAMPLADAARDLDTLFRDHWEWWMQDDPTWASSLGDHRWDGRWRDESPEAQAARDAKDRAALDRAGRIDRSALSRDQALSLDLFRRRLEDDLAERAFRQWLVPLDHMQGLQTAHELAEQLRFETIADFEGWIERMRALAPRAEQAESLMRAGMAEGRTLPRVLAARLPAQVAKQVVSDPEASPFFKPFRSLPDDIPAAEAERLRAAARAAVSLSVVPAYRRFGAFLETSYLPACRETVGASSLPRGEEYYAFRARTSTTTQLSPGEIHALGLSEVARLRAEMDKVMRSTGFSGTFEEFLHFLRTDPRFYAKTSDELFDRYLITCKRIDPELVKLFGRLPRMPYGLKPVPPEIAPDTTTAYYTGPADDGSRAGIYWANLYRPEVRPLYEIEALSLHEAVPGHHLQIALAQELGELPDFRRHAGYTAYVEGWGLYAESLGEELGLYRDPYSKFGQLTYEMWRAVRLVVDTGLHSLGWSRQQAIDYFKANAAKSEHDITNEIDRYIAWPGQALAYKVGELRIQELRRRARARLKDRFDIRGFHDAVLLNGAVPLDVLEMQVEDWMDSVEAKPASR